MSDMTIETARAVVAKGIEFGAWEWDDPAHGSDDEKVLTTAKMLTDTCRQATEKGSVNAAVLEILHAAQLEPVSDLSKQAFAQRFGGPAPAAAPAPAPQPAAASSAFADAPAGDVAPEDNGVDTQMRAEADVPTVEQINAIFGGVAYDDLKVAQIKSSVLDAAASGDLTPEEWAQIQAYEAANEDRKTIRELKPEFKASEPPPATDASAFGAPTDGPTRVIDHVTGSDVIINRTGDDAGDSITAFYNGETISRAAQEGLPIPVAPSAEASLTMPIDITTTSEADLSRLASAYHSLFARTQWLISQEEGRERAAEQLEHDAHRDAYNAAYENHKSAIPEGKSGPTALDAARKLAEKDADGAQAVHTWRTRKIRHGIDARELKALSAGYDKAVWRINEEMERRSRQQTTAGGAR